MISSANPFSRRRMQPRDEPRVFPKRAEITEDELDRQWGPINKAWLLDDSRLRPDWELSNNDIQAALERSYRYTSLQSGIKKPLVERGPATASPSPRFPSPTSPPSASVVDTQIRLICFDHVPSTGKHLILRLLHTSPSTLPSVQTYDAVSYVCGPPNHDATRTILILSSADGDDSGTRHVSHVRISNRVFTILKKLQTCFPPSVRFWIDALCINQQDDEERARQVRQMAKIYRRATRVHVFPGTATLEAEDVVGSGWFGRRWIVQEFVVAREVIVHSEVVGDGDGQAVEDIEVDGRVIPTWDKTALEATYQPWSAVIDRIRSSMNEDTMPTIQMETPNVSTVFNMISELERLQTTQRGGTQRGGILSLLCHFPHADCEDDRDRLYAFFGIANDLDTNEFKLPHHPPPQATTNTKSHSIPPLPRSPFSRTLSAINLATAISAARIHCPIDYTLPPSSIYLRFAKGVLQSAYPLDILHCAGAFRHPRNPISLASAAAMPESSTSVSGSGSGSGSELPSWVPDWRVQYPVYTPHLKSSSFASSLLSGQGDGSGSGPGGPLYTAGMAKTGASTTRPAVRLSEDETCVAVKGILVGVVGDVMALGSQIPSKSRSGGGGSGSGLDEEAVVAFFRAWHAHPRARKAVVNGWGGINIDGSGSGSSGEGLYVDGVPFDTVPGDVVVIFAGGTTPFVLRPSIGGYEVVGECYIHGMMYGEAMAGVDMDRMAEFVIL